MGQGYAFGYLNFRTLLIKNPNCLAYYKLSNRNAP